MSNTTVILKPEIDAEAVARVRDRIQSMNPGDEITITVESTDAHQAGPLISLLDDNGFDYQSKGSHDGRSYHINARRRL